jgi:hypothetical protein
MTLKVIGTGFGRTGTDSMREALDMLGFDPCHHMFEVNSNEEQKRLWRAFVQGEGPTDYRLLPCCVAEQDGRRCPTGQMRALVARKFPEQDAIDFSLIFATMPI